MDNGFCLTKGITQIETQGFHSGYIIKKWCYWPKGVPGDLIDTHFQDKDDGDAETIEEKNQENKPFRIFCIKYMDYVMKIMKSGMALDNLEGKKTRKYFTAVLSIDIK